MNKCRHRIFRKARIPLIARIGTFATPAQEIIRNSLKFTFGVGASVKVLAGVLQNVAS